MSTERLVRALRGATGVERDDPAAIEAATATLLTAMMERNEVQVDDLVSLIFTSTPDLTSAFPAAAARALGLGEAPLLCAQEIPVPGSEPRIVRILMHLYTERGYASLRHVYLGDARRLRADLAD